MFQLNINNNQKIHDINNERIIIGRSSEADLRLPLPDVSRKHATIHVKDNKIFIVDNQSLNGTLLNDKPCDEYHWYELREGDIIKISYFTIKVEAKTT